ncbi:hypothetical protein Cgig2_010118 [Carnegiea gigantea]|uniref:Uncharacterized protein n=1 Tax=Carnegiea gigantea TaxID=171969 RepID=A0A9Q1JQK3_9CARY|nr:hypothetical protein Cgig2_010118 [Carnegiea gigantea]
MTNLFTIQVNEITGHGAEHISSPAIASSSKTLASCAFDSGRTSTPGTGCQVAGGLVSVSSPLLAISGQTVPIQAETKKQSPRFSSSSRTLSATVDEYQRLKLNASHSGVEVNDDALFLQAAGGVNSKGLVYGLGNQTQAYYERVGLSTQSSPSTPIAYTPSMYAQIVSRLQKSEEQLNATREELTRTKEEVKQTKDAIARIESRFGSSSS